MPLSLSFKPRKVLFRVSLLAALLSSGFVQAADSNQAGAILGQLAGALGGGQVTTTNPYGLSNSIPNYNSAQLQAMSCVDLDLTENRINRDLQLRKQYASDLYEASKNAGTARQQQYGALAGLVGGILAQRGGKNAQIGQAAQQIGENMSGTASSQQLDTEISNLQQLNAQIEDLKTVKRYKNCNATATVNAVTQVPVTTSGNTVASSTVVVFNPANYPEGSVIVTPSGQILAFPKASKMRNSRGKLVTVYPEIAFPDGSKVRTPEGRLYLIKAESTGSATPTATISSTLMISNPAIYPKNSVVITPNGQRLALPTAKKMRNSSGKLVTVYTEVAYPKGSYVRSPAGKRYTIR